MRNYNDIVVNRIRDRLACSALPQPTATSRAPIYRVRSTLNPKEIPKPQNSLQINFIFICTHRVVVVFAYFDKQL
jgi:hypothetical protein